MRIALDTNVLVAALRSDLGASRQLLVAALEREYELLLSVPLVIEYEAVLTRPGHLKATGISAEDVGTLLDALVAASEPIQLSFHWRPISRDPGDDMVVETAVNGRADLLVTFDLRHFSKVVLPFGVVAASPGQALAKLREQT